MDSYSGDDVPDHIREEYKVNKEEQRLLNCFKKQTHISDISIRPFGSIQDSAHRQ